MEYAPPISGGRLVRQHALSGFRADLLTDIRSHGLMQYEHVLTVLGAESDAPVIVVASERSVAGPAGGSHVLGLFPGSGHVNFGESDEWADLETFEQAALGVAAEHLGLSGEWEAVGVPPGGD